MAEETTITNPTQSNSKAVPTAKVVTFFGIKLPNIFRTKKATRKKSDTLGKTINYIYPITIFVIIIGMVWFVYFLYNNVYQTMTSAETVNNLRANVATVSLEKDKFNEIIIKLQKKLQIDSWQAPAVVSNPFEYGARIDLKTAPVATTTPIIATTSPATSSSITSSKATSTK